MTYKEALVNAIFLWGEEAQLDMIVEECAELIFAIQKHKRGRSLENVYEEMADVRILLEQFQLIYPTYPQYEKKKSRLIKRVKKSLNDI